MHNPKEVWKIQDLTQFAVLILHNDSTGCCEMGDYFAKDADTMIDIVCEIDLNNNLFRIFIINGNIYEIV